MSGHPEEILFLLCPVGAQGTGVMQDTSCLPHLGPLTILNSTVGQEVLDGVSVDQPHAPALGRHAVLGLLLLGPRCGLLQLHLGQGCGDAQDRLPKIAGGPVFPASSHTQGCWAVTSLHSLFVPIFLSPC